MLLLGVVRTFWREDSDVPHGASHMATDIKRRSQMAAWEEIVKGPHERPQTT